MYCIGIGPMCSSEIVWAICGSMRNESEYICQVIEKPLLYTIYSSNHQKIPLSRGRRMICTILLGLKSLFVKLKGIPPFFSQDLNLPSVTDFYIILARDVTRTKIGSPVMDVLQCNKLISQFSKINLLWCCLISGDLRICVQVRGSKMNAIVTSSWLFFPCYR